MWLAPFLVSVAVAANVLAAASPSSLPVDARLQSLIQEAEERRQEQTEELQARRQEAREEMENRREEFRDRLAEMKDERKAEVLGNLDLRLTSVLAKWLEHWGKVLTRLSQILAKIEARAAELTQAGVDTSGVTAAIASAKEAIDQAEEGLANLAGKDYVFEIEDELNLGENVRALIAQFKADMAEVRQLIFAAREEVHQAFQELDSLRGENEE